MKADWETLPLNKVFWFQEGPGVRKWQFTDSGIKLLNVANIEKSGTLNLSKTDRHLSGAEVESKYSHFLVNEGDLVIASSGISFDEDGFLRTRGAFVEAHHLPLCLNTSTIRFKDIDGISDLRFLRLWLDSLEFRSQITRLVTGSAQQNFGPSHLKSLQISLPPIAEQKRIAAILDKAEELRGLRRKALGELDAIAQSIFLEMFGDPVTNSKGWRFLQFQNVLSTPLRNGVSPSNSGKVIGKVLTLSAITGSEFNASAIKTSTFQSTLPHRQTVSDTDFLICRGNGNLHLVGKGYFPTRSMYDVAFPDTMIAAQLELTRINRSFLQHIWNSIFVRLQIESVARTTNGTFKINQTMLESVSLPNPPLHLQQEFAHRIQAIAQLKATHRESLAQLDTLFASLQHRAFRGEL